MSRREIDEIAILQAARAIDDRAGRWQFLDQACGHDAALRERIGRLLAAATETIEPADSERPGLRIGRYRMLEQLGEGGMGTVWVAEQSEPVKRRVALKLIKPGMDSRQVLSRFEAERQALALMDHPNIAKVFDGGMTDGGRPYFVMEYVKGVPITAYCDNARLSIHDRLKLFVPVCQAVQHAHHKGVIHRDLKPSNILVCLYDGQPVPKVIDFGLAKAIHQPLTEHTLYTAHGLMLGTPLYMSPEQAELNNLDVDTRTDVYSLGVILYELLTGTTPLEGRRFQDAAFQEILRLIKEVEPPRPSLKISSSASLPSIAAQRSLDPAQLSRIVRGDLDWIVMKSLEKERSRRYETAAGMARDIERYLASEPIQARPPSSAYRLRKFAQRNKVTVAAGLIVALSLLLGTAVSTWLAIRATSAERLAQQRLMNEQQALREAITARQDTAHELVRAVKAETESQANLQALQQVAREWAVSETLTGDPERAEAAIRLAEAAQASKAWTEILRAQAEMDRGLYESPVTRLSPIAKDTYPHGTGDSQLAALSLLAYAHFMNGNAAALRRCQTRIGQFPQDASPEAGLFKAIGQMRKEPENAIATLAVATEKRAYPASLLIRGNARTCLAAESTRLAEDERYALIHDAIQDLQYARLFAGDSASVILGKLEAHYYGYHIATRLGKKEAADAHLAELGTCLEQSEKLPKTPMNAIFVVDAYNVFNRFDKAFEFARGVDDWGNALLISFVAAELYQRMEDPLIALGQLKQLKFSKDNPYALVANAHFLAEIPSRRSDLRGLYERIVAAHPEPEPEGREARLAALPILALLGQPSELQAQAKEVLRLYGNTADDSGSSVGPTLRYLAGEWSEERALQEASGPNECEVQQAIAIHCLASGDRNGAREHFEECIRTGQDRRLAYQWSRGYLERTKHDPNWPDWIEKK